MKKSKLKAITYTLPAYLASYLINNDASGITSEDQYYADKFLADRNLPMPSTCGESYFSGRNDIGDKLAGDVCDYTFLI